MCVHKRSRIPTVQVTKLKKLQRLLFKVQDNASINKKQNQSTVLSTKLLFEASQICKGFMNDVV